jgi:folate-dependent tRNA-U54 methylase TrmFO/GidA
MQEVYMSSDEETMTTATFSTVAAGDSANLDHDMDSPLREESYKQFQHAMESATDTHVSTCKSTYFFDGGKRFISVSIPRHGMSLFRFNSCRVISFNRFLETNSSPRLVTPTSRQLL